jgi:hypothetical protein
MKAIGIAAANGVMNRIAAGIIANQNFKLFGNRVANKPAISRFTRQKEMYIATKIFRISSNWATSSLDKKTR